jgi:hypothetical protein
MKFSRFKIEESMRQLTTLLMLCLAGFWHSLYGQETILSDIRDVSPEEIIVEGFSLDRDQEVKIEAVAFRPGRRHYFMFTQSWILNSQTREVVWDMSEADSKKRGRNLIEFNLALQLPKGTYEVYYATFPYYTYKHDRWGNYFGRFFDEIFKDEDAEDLYAEFRDELKSFYITVRGSGKRYAEAEVQQLHDAYNQTAIISLTALRDDVYERRGLSLEKPMELQVYAIGEARNDGTFDYGWIMNAQTREIVWKMTYRDSEHAGGAEKNCMVNELISLPAGKYVVFVVTDDSHSYDKWNSAPPYDPMFWGLTIRVKDPAMKQYVKVYDYEDLPEKNVIVKLNRLRDSEFASKGFSLKKPMSLRIYALGEGRDGDMFDYGWIVDAQSHKKIWEMDYHDTEHGGGDQKNRLFDGVVKFERGDYIVYFVTDDSHSYWDWNSSPPYDQEGWGITILAADEQFDPNSVADYEPQKDGTILAQLVRIRDGEHERERFTLERDRDVRIYAIGEGKDGNMYDYGWIEDANTRKVVWEMTYRQTEHAGGASKNRLFDDVIRLKKGEYFVYYETDDSHSFNDWNDSPPYDPVNWGITIYLAEGE